MRLVIVSDAKREETTSSGIFFEKILCNKHEFYKTQPLYLNVYWNVSL